MGHDYYESNPKIPKLKSESRRPTSVFLSSCQSDESMQQK